MIEISTQPTLNKQTATARVVGLTSADQPSTHTSHVRYTANIDLDQSGQAWLPAFLPLLMNTTEHARFTEPQDSTALENANKAQGVLCSWYSALNQVEISAESRMIERPQNRGVGCFFSGGVDSFYSALDQADAVTHLIFVQGFDIPFDDAGLAAKAKAEIMAAANALGKELIVVHTDVRKVSNPIASWPKQYHGAALASVGLLLANHLRHFIVPSSYHTSELFPWASHPELDHLWSSSTVTFEHHGIELFRSDKIEAIASNPTAMKHLRVCWENPNGAYNCGRCEKCVRTMISLHVFGALEACATLPDRINPNDLRAVRPTHGDVIFAKANLSLMRDHGLNDRAITRALRGMVRRAHFWRVVNSIRSRIRRN